MKNFFTKLDDESFAYIAGHGGFIDAAPGGFVIGKTHNEGGIMRVKPNEDGETIDLAGEMEHGEYIMCPEATNMYKDRLVEINADNEFNEIISVDNIRLKSALFTGKTFAALVITGGEQFIINAKSTAKHLDELDELNSSAKSQ